MARLTAKLIERLQDEGSDDIRRETAGLVATEFAEQRLSDAEREMALDIFRTMIHGTDVGVRTMISKNLKHDESIPRDVATTLARDIIEVAAPMLHHSLVFSDTDLMEIIDSQGEDWWHAVALRKSIPAIVCHKLVDTGSERVVGTLVSNNGAELSERTTENMIDRFTESERVMTGLAERPSLPPHLAERLISVVSDSIRLQFSEREDLPPGIAERLVLQSQETAVLNLKNNSERKAYLIRLINHLHQRERLSPSLVLRALCTGEFGFFEMAMARLADIPVENAQELIHDKGPLGAESLCQASGLPVEIHQIVGTILTIRQDIVGNLDDIDGAYARDQFQRRIVKYYRDELDNFFGKSPDALLTRFPELLPEAG